MSETRSPNLRKKLEQHLDDLPVLPTVVGQLMTLDRDDQDYFENVRKLIEADPNFTVRVLAAANSASSAPRSPIVSVRSAVVRLGAMSVSNLILSFAVTRVFVPRDPWEKSLWRHALQVALAARALAEFAHTSDICPDEAYSSALLHDIGRFVMFQEAPELLRRVDEGDWHTPDALILEERKICEMTHTELGALACSKWQLPEVIVAVVRDHHSPKPLTGRVGMLTSLIRLADLAMFPSATPGVPGLEEAEDEILNQVLMPKLPSFLHITLAELKTIIAATAAEADSISKSLGVA